ncbi:MAG TPA: carboxypeptidase-like regulatory domain-containing protein [Parasegetibacter sp.]
MKTIPITVKGKVVDENGMPVEGVTVTVKGQSKNTVTDKNGEFTFSLVDQDVVLVFSHVGMETVEESVQNNTELLVVMKPRVSSLSGVELIVYTGYQQLPQERVTSSFGIINNEQLNRKAGTDILSRLEGLTTGIQFDKRFLLPNQSAIGVNNIMVRGLSTLTNQIKSPLIVIDNFPYDGGYQ